MSGLTKGDAALKAAIGHANVASEIVRDMSVSQLDQAAQERISNLRAALDEVLSCLAAAETYETKLRTEISWSKERAAMLLDWEAERDTFELRRFDPGVFVYKRKKGGLRPKKLSSLESEYLLCPHCFEGHKKSILQSTPKFERRYQVHMCPECRSEFAFYYAPNGVAI